MKTILRFILALLVVVVPVVLVQVSVALLGLGKLPTHVLAAVLSVAACCSAYYTYVRFVEKRPLTEFAPRGALTELGCGALIGAGLFSGTIGVLAALGLYRITSVGSVSDLIAPLAAAMAAAVTEEIVFRGVIFRLSERSLGTVLALLISAAVFVDSPIERERDPAGRAEHYF